VTNQLSGHRLGAFFIEPDSFDNNVPFDNTTPIYLINLINNENAHLISTNLRNGTLLSTKSGSVKERIQMTADWSLLISLYGCARSAHAYIWQLANDVICEYIRNMHGINSTLYSDLLFCIC